MVDRGALEKRCGLAGHRGFESHPLRLKDIRRDVLFLYFRKGVNPTESCFKRSGKRSRIDIVKTMGDLPAWIYFQLRPRLFPVTSRYRL